MKRIVFVALMGILLTYGILMIPGNNKVNIEREGNATPFIWDQDERWVALEKKYTDSKEMTGPALTDSIELKKRKLDRIVSDLKQSEFNPTSPKISALIDQFFEIAPLIAAQNKKDDYLLNRYNESRKIIKEQSVYWDINDPETRVSLYKSLYGMRAATEEVLLQTKGEIDPVLLVQDEKSATPSATILGIKVHSGDLLVSRGGAEVSALISRGNDYPGNFSHVALLYIDEKTNEPYLIEAHIERGVAIATAEEYINDRKLRFMVLRPRQDLPEIQKDPMIPHKAAKSAFQEAQKRHIPYDFKMDFYDPEAMFCSEVGSYAYKKEGIQLWQSESTISSKGVVTLLNTFGVENFVTQMPSDLEYDPQLSVVGEWRDTRALFEDHLYNAVIDGMLMCAEKDEEIEYNPWMLPAVRLVKAYSYVMNIAGKTGPVPEGMSAMQAIKSDAFIQRHEQLKHRVMEKADRFKKENNYTPPYWELVEMAEQETGCR